MKPYSCNDYRQEMILAGLKRRLARADLDPQEKQRLIEEIRKLESDMGLD